MERYLQFTNKDGSTFLVEVDEEEVLSPGGMEKAGLKDKVKEIGGKMIVTAQEIFEDAVNNLIQSNAKAFLQAIRNLPQQDQPEFLEVNFGIKATGEVGNSAVAKGTGEANYTVKLTWKRNEGGRLNDSEFD